MESGENFQHNQERKQTYVEVAVRRYFEQGHIHITLTIV